MAAKKETAIRRFTGSQLELIRVPSLNSVEIEQISQEAKLIFAICRQLMFNEEDSTIFLHPVANVSSLASLQSLNEISDVYQASISRSRDSVLLAMERIDRLVESAVPEELREFCKHSGLLEERNKLWNNDDHSTENILSYALGCVFGRWDILFANGAKQAAEISAPFEPLPICPPGMLQNIHRLPATPKDLPTDYPLDVSWHGVLVDDLGHFKDIEQCVREAFYVIWPDHADAIEQEACEILGVASLRAYFANPSRFFDDHLKRYSKSRRAAPIYWPLSTPSGSYTLWLYYHRLTDQTLYSCVNDFVDLKLKGVNETVATLQRRTNRSRLEEQELEQQSALALELAAFRDELLRIARCWQPNLNDGVQITAAPLWRLFQHRAWQKRLKETWEKLEAGDYDWAHLAYSLWPERVREKCKTDKSLAIAHELEGLYVEPVKVVKAKKGRGKKQVVDEDEQGELL